jgi:hypothetical protein
MRPWPCSPWPGAGGSPALPPLSPFPAHRPPAPPGPDQGAPPLRALSGPPRGDDERPGEVTAVVGGLPDTSLSPTQAKRRVTIRRTHPDKIKALLSRVSRGESIKSAASLVGLHYDTALAIMDDVRHGATFTSLVSDGRGTTDKARVAAGALDSSATADTTWPIPLNLLNRHAKRSLTDIGFFAERYHGLKLVPWQIQATNRIKELLATPEEEFVVINVAVGTGKTTFFTRVIPEWLTIADRSIRGLLGSATHGLATNLTDSLRSDFTSVYPARANAKDLRDGVATDAAATLVSEFGRFKPEADEKNVWRQDAFIVAQFDSTPVTAKEPTWAAMGRDSAFIGFRVQIAVWDDVYDPSKVRSVETLTAMTDWWTDVVEKRIEPGGLLILQGQRLAANDIYGFALEQHIPVVDYSPYSPDGEIQYRPKYHHIVFKAHYDDPEYCDHPRTHDPATAYKYPYPLGCLLYPRRIGYRRILEEAHRDPSKFATIYQQDPTSALDTLARRVWIEGGVDPETGEQYDGCYDDNRGIMDIPKHLTPPLYSIATVDPSSSNYWAIHHYLYHPATEQRFLLDIFNGRMGGNDLLDWDNNEQAYTGLMEEWQERSMRLGIPISHWVIEVNAFAKYLVQYDHVRRWKMTRSVALIPHTTGVNKAHSDYGITTTQTRYKFGHLRLPGHPLARKKVAKFVTEACNFRLDFSHTCSDDNPMSYWFLEFTIPKLVKRTQTATVQRRPFDVYSYLPSSSSWR